MNQNNMFINRLNDFNKWLLATVVVSIFVIFVTLFLFGKQADADTGSYIATINNILQGNLSSLEPNRILRSGGLLLAIPITKFVSPLNALLFVNYLSYLLGGVLVFAILNKIFLDGRKSFLGTVFFLTTFPILRFGLAALTDMPAWLLFLLTVYLLIRFREEIKVRHMAILGLAAGAGFVVKESGGMGMFFIASFLFFTYKNDWIKLIKLLSVLSFAFLFVVVLNQIFVYNLVHFTYLDWYLYNTKTYVKESYTIFNWIKNLLILFGIGWVFLLVGVKEGWKSIKSNILILSLILPSVSFIFWPSITARLMYISGLLFAILAAFGFEYFYLKNKVLAFGMFFVCIIANLVLVQLSYF